MESLNDNECDSDSDDEFTYDQKVVFMNNLIVVNEKLIKNYLRDHDIYLKLTKPRLMC